MSDRLRDTAAVTSVTNALTKRIRDSEAIIANLTDYLLPKRPVLPQKQDKVKSSYVKSLCEKYGVSVLSPILIPEITEFYSDKMFIDRRAWKMVVDLDSADGKNCRVDLLRTAVSPDHTEEGGYPYFIPTKLQLPVGKKMRMSKYQPPFRAAGYDENFLKQVIHWFLMSKGIGPGKNGVSTTNVTPIEMGDADSQLAKIFDVAAHTYIGTPTLEAQIKRLADVRDVNLGRGYYKAKDVISQGYTMESVARILETTLPLAMVDKRYNKLVKYPSEYLTFGGNPESIDDEVPIIDFFPKINSKGAAGLPWMQGRTKRDAFWDGVAICDSLLKKTSSCLLARNSETRLVKTLSDIMKSFRYLEEVYIFGKEERYPTTIDGVAEKARNIMSVGLAPHMLGSFMVHDNYPPVGGQPPKSINVTNSETPSLYKFSALKGGMDIFVTKIRGAKDTRYFIYADNLYLLFKEDDGTFTWFSLDLVKGEANAHYTHAVAIAYYFITRKFLDITKDGVESRITNTWMFVLMVLMPICYCTASGVIGNQRVPINGQTSGGPWTFLINHVISSIFADAWLKAKTPRPGSEGFASLMERLGINFKIELENKDILRQLNEAYSRPVNLTEIPLTYEPRIINLDLLGWNTVFILLNGSIVAVPILMESRILSSSIFPQEPKSLFKNLEKEQLGNKLLKVIQMYALFMLGAWAYPLLYRAIHSSHEYIKDEISRILDVATIGSQIDISSITEGMQVQSEIDDVIDLLKFNAFKIFDTSIFDKLYSGHAQPKPKQMRLSKKINFGISKFFSYSVKCFTKDILPLRALSYTAWGDMYDDEDNEPNDEAREMHFVRTFDEDVNDAKRILEEDSRLDMERYKSERGKEVVNYLSADTYKEEGYIYNNRQISNIGINKPGLVSAGIKEQFNIPHEITTSNKKTIKRREQRKKNAQVTKTKIKAAEPWIGEGLKDKMRLALKENDEGLT